MDEAHSELGQSTCRPSTRLASYGGCSGLAIALENQLFVEGAYQLCRRALCRAPVYATQSWKATGPLADSRGVKTVTRTVGAGQSQAPDTPKEWSNIPPYISSRLWSSLSITASP